MKAAALFACLLISFSAQAQAAQDKDAPMTGGWSDTPVTSENTALLIQALSNRTNYADSISRPVCVQQVTRVQEQVVSGTNYLYEVNGCPVNFSEPQSLGACKGANSNCGAAQFVIRVYSQPWTATLRVQSIN